MCVLVQLRLMPSIKTMRAIAGSATSLRELENDVDEFVWGSSGLEQETLLYYTERRTSCDSYIAKSAE